MRKLFLLPLLLVLGACATVQRYDAAQDVHALLIAIRDNDRAAFDAHVDKPALKAQLEGRLVSELRSSNASPALKALGLFAAQPTAAIAAEALLRPSVFRLVAEYYGYGPGTPIPSPMALTWALKYAGPDRVCVEGKQKGSCLLEFTLQGQSWKLSGYDGGLSELNLRP